MWRTFIKWGVGLLIGGFVLLIIAVTRTGGVLLNGGGGGIALLYLLGLLCSGVGGLLLNAGLIGAAVGADPQTYALGSSPSQRPYATSSAPQQQVALIPSGPGDMFRGVADSGAIFVPLTGDYIELTDILYGQPRRRRLMLSQITSVEVIEDYKVIAAMSDAEEWQATKAKLSSADHPRQVTTLGIRLKLADQEHLQQNTWFHSGRTIDVSTPEYGRAWNETVRCYDALGALLRPAASTGSPAAQAASPAGASTVLPPNARGFAAGAPTAVSLPLGFCPQCGSRRGPDHQFCENCGASLGA
jgi:hypothetical protein